MWRIIKGFCCAAVLIPAARSSLHLREETPAWIVSAAAAVADAYDWVQRIRPWSKLITLLIATLYLNLLGQVLPTRITMRVCCVQDSVKFSQWMSFAFGVCLIAYVSCSDFSMYPVKLLRRCRLGCLFHFPFYQLLFLLQSQAIRELGTASRSRKQYCENTFYVTNKCVACKYAIEML